MLIDLPAGLPQVLADRRRMVQVLNNLLANAARYSTEEVLGQHLWGRGYSCATVGAVDEHTVREYIEGPTWDEGAEGFRVVAPEAP